MDKENRIVKLLELLNQQMMVSNNLKMTELMYNAKLMPQEDFKEEMTYIHKLGTEVFINCLKEGL